MMEMEIGIGLKEMGAVRRGNRQSSGRGIGGVANSGFGFLAFLGSDPSIPLDEESAKEPSPRN